MRKNNRVQIVKPLKKMPKNPDGTPSIFLGGSINMGKSKDWQTILTNRLMSDDEVGNLIVLNPRRDDWDSSLEMNPKKGTEFFKQVMWELEAQEKASVLIYWFEDDMMSPITLLELGLALGRDSSRVVVYATPKYQRYGNVKITCDWYGVEVYDNEDLFYEDLKNMIRELSVIYETNLR